MQASLLIFHNIVTHPALRIGLVFNRLCGATADAGHAVSAVALPSGLFIHHADVGKGTALGTETAGDADIRHPKALIANKKPVKQWIDGAAQQLSHQKRSFLGERLSRAKPRG